MLIAVVLLAAAARPATADEAADFELGVRWSGGFGAALDTPRPIFLGSVGVDGFFPLTAEHALGIGLDALWREYPDSSRPPNRPEASAGLTYRWRRQRARKGWRPWLAAGAGYRQRRIDDPSDDPLLGVVTHRGVSLAFEGGGDVRLSRDTRLALYFNWTIGCYFTATRAGASRYVEVYDEPPPAVRDVACIDSSSSTYSGGLRWSMEFR